MAETVLLRQVTICHHTKGFLRKLFYRSLITDTGSDLGVCAPCCTKDTPIRTTSQNYNRTSKNVNITPTASSGLSTGTTTHLNTSSSAALASTTASVTTATTTTTTTTTTLATTATPLSATGAPPTLKWNYATRATTPASITSPSALAPGTTLTAVLGAVKCVVSPSLGPAAPLTTAAALRLSTSAAVSAAPARREGQPAATGAPVSCPFSGTRTLVTNRSSTDKSPSSGSATTRPLTMKELPGPKGWPFLGTFPEFLRKENRGCVHKVQLKFHKKYGRMFKLNFGPHTNVCLADPNLVEEFMRMEGKHPNRPPYQSWVLYKELRKKETGLMTAADEKWHKYRSAIAPRLLRPQMAAGYTDKLSNIVSDLINRIHKIKNTEDHTVPMLQNELYKWATESVGCVLFGRRLGCLQEHMPQNIQDLINAVGVMFVTGHQMAVGANVHQILNTSIWQKHVSASDIIYGLAQEFIEQQLTEISHDRSGVSSSNSGSDVLTYLLSNQSFSIAEIYSNMAELFLAGLDTASNSLGFAIYLLAKYPKVQQKLQEEISRTLQGENCSSSHLANMPYLKAVVKESMRLYPVIPIGARITTDDIVLDGYLIPKGTCLMINNYVMSRDETIFPDANDFIPERWFRSDTRKFHPFAVIPFGHGSRSCIGRRVAELELYLAITNICQNFWLTLQEGFEVEPFLRTVLTVGEHFPIQFVNR